ncbi:LysR family transcriptional regulator [Azospirillum sp. SYSU D00513]|uniref:LysR family transcriptional regulator n=1 Tax=Azospirillum sp. SYSU D00513 TaxID=2812561 RepID=UPI001A96D8DB|nr:LysR family transcriptional regulator [Azospirillum sp. SYSU D00513]
MTIRHATVRQLQIFVEAARSLSFTRVAEKLNLTPAAVSFQIRQIEGLSGFPLFERVGRRVVLTDAGKALVDYAAIVLKALHDADQRMMALKGLSGGQVTIGLVSTAKYIVPHMLGRFQTMYPGVSIHLQDGNRREIQEALMKGEIDIAVTGRPPDETEVEAHPFAPHPSVIIAPPNHPLAHGSAAQLWARNIPLNALANDRFILREMGSGTRALMDRYFQDHGFAPEITMISSSNETIKQAVIAGMGVSLISRHTIGLELKLGMLAVLPVEGLPLMRSWYVTHRRNMPLLPVHQQLCNYLIENGRNIIDEINGVEPGSDDALARSDVHAPS